MVENDKATNDEHAPVRCNCAYLLNEEELADPSINFTSFLQSMNLSEHRSMLWDILRAALRGATEDGATVEEVASWVIYIRRLETCIEALNEWHKGRR